MSGNCVCGPLNRRWSRKSPEVPSRVGLGLKSFISDRYTTVSSQLDSYSHSCTAVGIEEEEAAVTSHSVYPNPSSSGIFNIVFGEAVDQITVYDISGKIIHSQLVSDQLQTELDLSGFANGFFIVDLLGETREQLRIIKQ